MIGRGRELAALQEALRSGSAVLEGDAGIGKSTLWNAVLARSERRVLRCRPAATETQLPFAALGDLLDGVELPELPAPQRGALEVALQRAEPAGRPPDVRAIGGAFLGVLRALAPVLVAVDDAQWLDASSRSVLEFAVRRAGDAPIAVLAAHGGHGAPPLGLDRAARVALAPLSRGELHAILEARLGLTLAWPLLKRVHAAAGGNPFYALELGRALQRRGRAPGADEPLPVPARLVDERLAALPEHVRRLLALVDALFVPRLATVQGEDGLDDVIAAGVLELDGDRVRFAHPLLAAAVRAQVGPEQRAALHARLVEGEPDAWALHLALATVRPDAGIADRLEAAARAASERGAAEIAGRLSEHAARLTPAQDVDTVARRTLAAAYRHLAAGDPERVRVLLGDLVARLEPGGVRAEALSVLQWVAPREGGVARSIQIGEQALAEAGEDRRIALTMRASLAVLERVRGHLAASEAHARAAVELAEAGGDRVRLATALASLGHAQLVRGAGVTPELRRAVELERSLPRFLGQGSPARRLGIGLMLAGDFGGARAVLSDAYERADAAGREDARAHILAALADVERRAGDWRRASELTAEMLELSGQVATEQEHTAHQVVAALLDAGLGRIEEATRRATAALEVAERIGDAMCAIGLRSVLGFVALSARDPAGAVAWLAPASDACLERAPLELGLYPAPYLEAEARVALGDPERAEALIGAFAASPWMRRARGLLEAEPFATLEPEPFERARSLIALGSIERRAKRWGASRAALEQAGEVLDALPAPLWAGIARDELGRSGRRSAAGLSDTEARVAELAGGGPDEPGDRRCAVHQPQDRGGEPLQDLPQARRALTRGARAPDPLTDPAGEQADAGKLQAGRRLVRGDGGAQPGQQGERGVVSERRDPPRQRTRERRRARPPLLELRVAQRHRELADDDVVERQQRAQLLGVGERERPGDAGRGHRLAQLRAHGVEDEAEPRVALARAPDRERGAPTRLEHAADLARGARGVAREHQALTAEHGVVGAVGLGDAVEVEHARAHVGEPACRSAAGGDRGHRARDVREHHLAGQLRGRQSGTAGPAGEFEHAVAGLDRRQLEHPGGDLRSAGVGVVGVLLPAAGHRRPHSVQSDRSHGRSFQGPSARAIRAARGRGRRALHGGTAVSAAALPASIGELPQNLPEITSQARRSLSPRSPPDRSSGPAESVAGFALGSGSWSTSYAASVSVTPSLSMLATWKASTNRCPPEHLTTRPSKMSALGSASTCATWPTGCPSRDWTGAPSLSVR